MAEGRSSCGIAGKHIASIFGNPSLQPEAADNRHVFAVLRYLRE